MPSAAHTGRGCQACVVLHRQLLGIPAVHKLGKQLAALLGGQLVEEEALLGRQPGAELWVAGEVIILRDLTRLQQAVQPHQALQEQA